MWHKYFRFKITGDLARLFMALKYFKPCFSYKVFHKAQLIKSRLQIKKQKY